MMKPFRAPRKAKELAKPPERESEAPTELGVVRERHIIKETEEEDKTSRTVAVKDILFDEDSDDDDVPIVATLPPRPSNLSLLAMAATQKRSKKAPKQLWTYETVSEPTGIVSTFVTNKQEPTHKGKSVLTDKVWAAQIYNPRRMFVMHRMAAWLEKHPAKKSDTNAKKVCFDVNMYKCALVAVNHEYIFLTRTD